MSVANGITRSVSAAMVDPMTPAAPQAALANEVAHDTVPVATNGVADITGTALMRDAITMRRSRFPRTELTENGVRHLVHSLDDGATYVPGKGVCPDEARSVTYHDRRGRIQSAECR